MHPLGSPYVRDQLSLRIAAANEKRTQPDGAFVLYWMQSTQRLDENWALRFATLEADRLGRPLLIHQSLEPSYEHASERFHTFVIEGARDVAREAAERGYHYQFSLDRRHGESDATLDKLAARASLVVTDLLPTGGVRERTAGLAGRAPCRVVAVDSVGIVPAATFFREEYAARTIRPKLAKLRDHCLEPVEDRPPKRALPSTVALSLETETLDLARTDVAAEVARCPVDHDVRAVATRGGSAAARRRLERFVGQGLASYTSRRKEPSDVEGSSRLSPYLSFGQISAAEVARAVLAHGPAAEAEAFLDEMLTWRELALNFCFHNPRYDSLDALPDWVRRSMAKHDADPRETEYMLAELEEGRTHDALWNAGQRELVETGHMHNAVRMLWGKSVLLWTASYGDALRYILHLNNKYGLDGRDPNSFANILWCFGKFDRPFAARPVWGTIRPMSLQRAREKFDTAAYIERWSAPPVEMAVGA